MNRCAYTVGRWTCGYPREHAIHDAAMSPIWRVHPYMEEPMPEARVTIGTVLSFFEPDDMDNRENGAKPNVTLQFSRGDRLPRIGERVAVAGSVDAIFKWMGSLPAARVLEAAKAWAASVGDGRLPDTGRVGTFDKRAALLDAVEALGEAPSEAYEPPVIRDRPHAVVLGLPATITIKITEDA